MFTRHLAIYTYSVPFWDVILAGNEQSQISQQKGLPVVKNLSRFRTQGLSPFIKLVKPKKKHPLKGYLFLFLVPWENAGGNAQVQGQAVHAQLGRH